MNVSNSIPIGPLGQQPADHVGDAAGPDGQSSTPRAADARQEPAHPVSNAVAIATQLVQDARAAKGTGNSPSLAGPMNDLVNSVTSQMGANHLTDEQKQSIAARLAEDPAIKTLIGIG